MELICKNCLHKQVCGTVGQPCENFILNKVETEKVRQCPFCSYKKVSVLNRSFRGNLMQGTVKYRVECPNCGATFKQWASTRFEAILKWNGRRGEK